MPLQEWWPLEKGADVLYPPIEKNRKQRIRKPHSSGLHENEHQLLPIVKEKYAAPKSLEDVIWILSRTVWGWAKIFLRIFLGFFEDMAGILPNMGWGLLGLIPQTIHGFLWECGVNVVVDGSRMVVDVSVDCFRIFEDVGWVLSRRVQGQLGMVPWISLRIRPGFV